MPPSSTTLPPGFPLTLPKAFHLDNVWELKPGAEWNVEGLTDGTAATCAAAFEQSFRAAGVTPTTSVDPVLLILSGKAGGYTLEVRLIDTGGQCDTSIVTTRG